MTRLGIAIVLATLVAGSAQAADLKRVAMIEAAPTGNSTLHALDYLTEGQTVELGANGVLTLDYLQSCIRETITGGAVRIGTAQSDVTGGHVERHRVDCDGSDLALTAQQSDAGGVAIYRHLGDDKAPALILFSTAPVVVTASAAPVTVERLDAPSPKISVSSGAAADGSARFELAALAEGGIYRISQGERVLVVRIAPGAPGATAPLLQRLAPL